MKKALICTFFAVCLIFILLPTVSAEEGGEYSISKDGGEYILSSSGEGGESILYRGTLSSALERVESGSRISFCGLASSESLTLPEGNYTLTGALTLTGDGSLIVGEGTSLVLSGFTLAFSDGARGLLRIKGGSVTVSDSSVLGAAAGAVLLDYSASSSLTLESGLLFSNSDYPALRIESGEALLLGGRISGSYGAAVRNEGSLTLLGSPTFDGAVTDIETSRAIRFSRANDGYTGGSAFSVTYLGKFSEGSMTPVVYGVKTREALSGITLFDLEGKREELSYFESSPHTEDKSFAAVYKPFSVSFFDGENTVKKNYLKGEQLLAPDEPSRLGYSFSGWYFDGEEERACSFGVPVECSLSLHAKYELLPPSFEIGSVNTVYDGEVHSLSFSALTHPLIDRGGFFSLLWYKDGECVGSGEELLYSRVGDSGIYECKITFSFEQDSVSVLADGIKISIERAKVNPPAIPSAFYTGNPISPTLQPSSLYTAASISETEAGVYYLTAKLVDPENFRWVGIEGEEVRLPFLILPAQNGFAEPPKVSDCFLGNAPTVSATPLFGEVEILYSTSKNGEYSRDLPTKVGKYYLKAVVNASGNYEGVSSEPLSFSVLADEVSELSLEREAARSSYRAFDSFDGAGLLLRAIYKSGKSETVGIEKLSVSYQKADSFRYGDSAVILSYSGVLLSYPVSVSRAEYDLSELVFSDLTTVFDGKYHTVMPSINEIIGKDGIPLTLSVSGGGRDCGEYTVTLSFLTDSRNYNTPAPISARLSVTPLEVLLSFGDCSFLYDGTPKLPTATYVDAFGVLRYAVLLGASTDAGTYVARAEEKANYLFQNPECSFEIRKAEYDLSALTWVGVNFLYDGREHGVHLSGLPSGVSVVGYTDARAISSGEYTASATLAYDEKNYNPPIAPTHTWRVLQAEYDISGLVFSSTEFVFDGKIHYPSVIGELPVGIDGIPLTYSFSRGSVNTSDSEIPIRVIFSTESRNYRVPPDVVLYAKITPLGITVEWEGEELVYNGRTQAPDCYSPLAEVTVEGAAVNAGEYLATARPLSENFYIINPEFSFVIKKAENRWTSPSLIESFYESGTPSPKAKSLYGEPRFKYYKDRACTEEVTLPLSHGVYYMRAEVSEGDNYLGIISEPIEFEVIEVLPVSLEARVLNKSLKAYSKIGKSDIEITVFYNDGARRTLDGSQVEIIYENEGGLRRTDTAVTVRAEGLSLGVPVSVGYADYDLSGVRWEGLRTEYDGKPHAPTLVGLPEGVFVLEYLGETATSAGTYTFSALLSYDAENYNAPIVESCTLVIEKQKVSPPTVETEIYDSTLKSPDLQSDIYIVSGFEPKTDAGRYSVTLVLVDSDNYEFVEGGSECTVIFEILPRVINLKSKPVKVYLWQRPRESGYTLLNTDFEGALPPLYREIIDGKIHFKSSDPNYLVITEAAAVDYRPYPAPLVCILLILLLLLAAFLLYFFLVLRKRRALPPPEESSEEPIPESPVSETESNASDDADPEPQEPEGDGKGEESIESDGEANGESEAPDCESEARDGENASPAADGRSSAFSMNPEYADSLISDSLAKNLLRKGEDVRTEGRERSIINVDTLNTNFTGGDRVDINILKKKSLVPYDTAYIKVLARGILDKPLTVYANDFSLSAVKMIALTGGEAIKVSSSRYKKRKRS